MKGIVFTEFLELVEEAHGMEVADRVITKGCPFHMGFTAVATYDYQELLAMVTELSRETSTPVSELVQVFGKHLFHTFLRNYPESFEGVSGTEELLTKVEETIHIEVRKLNPDAELPEFSFPECEDGVFEVIYRSARPFADLCEGLIMASIEHYGESFSLQRFDLEGTPGTHAKFRLS